MITKGENCYRNNLTKEEQEMLFVSFISYNKDSQRLACESILNNVNNDLIDTLAILYQMNIDISSKEGFYLAELISFWVSFELEELKKLLLQDIMYFYSPITITYKLNEDEAINIIDKALINVNVNKKTFILGILSILRENKNKKQKKYIRKTTM